MTRSVAVSEISQRLANRAEEVCKLLLPNGNSHGKVFECGSIYGEKGKTLKVNLTGEHAGNWVDWNGAEHKGDLLDLWRYTKNISLPDAIREAKAFLGIREPTLPEKKYSRPKDDAPVLSPNGDAMQWFATKRKIEPPIVNRFKVQGDRNRKCVIFPAYSPSGKLLIRSYRTLTEPKKVWQDTDAEPALFGWHALDESAYYKREVLLCEGQVDAMTWTQWGIPALSIPNGAGMAWLETEWANLEAFKTIFLAFDNDAAGEKFTTDVLQRLGKHRVRLVRYPCKDANEALLDGHTAEEAREWVEKAEYATVSHLVKADHFLAGTVEQFFPSQAEIGHYIPQTVHDNPEYTFRFRPGELTIWTGTSSHGKSTLLNFAMAQLASKMKRPSLIVSLEMKPAKVLKRIILGTGVAITSPEDVKMVLETLNSWVLFCDKIGKITKEELFEIMQYAVARYGTAHIAIDSLMRIKGLEEDYPAQNEFITDLVTFSRETDCHIHLVAHPRKSPGNSAPQAHDIKGSGHIRDNADNVLVLWRDMEKEKALAADPKDAKAKLAPDSKLMVEKDREEGIYREFPLKFNPSTYSYSKWTKPL